MPKTMMKYISLSKRERLLLDGTRQSDSAFYWTTMKMTVNGGNTMTWKFFRETGLISKMMKKTKTKKNGSPTEKWPDEIPSER